MGDQDFTPGHPTAFAGVINRSGGPGKPLRSIGFLEGNGAGELVALLRQLPRNQRAAIVLHYYVDRPVREVAAVLGVTPATARVHLHRGRRRLRRLLEEADE